MPANSWKRSRLTCTCVAFRSSVPNSHERQVKSAESGGESRPWKTFQLIAESSMDLARALPREWLVSLLMPFPLPGAYHARLPVARHFLTGQELSRDELDSLLDRAAELKSGRSAGEGRGAL